MLVSVARLKYDVTEDPNVGVCSEAKVCCDRGPKCWCL